MRERNGVAIVIKREPGEFCSRLLAIEVGCDNCVLRVVLWRVRVLPRTEVETRWKNAMLSKTEKLDVASFSKFTSVLQATPALL